MGHQRALERPLNLGLGGLVGGVLGVKIHPDRGASVMLDIPANRNHSSITPSSTEPSMAFGRPYREFTAPRRNRAIPAEFKFAVEAKDGEDKATASAPSSEGRVGAPRVFCRKTANASDPDSASTLLTCPPEISRSEQRWDHDRYSTMSARRHTARKLRPVGRGANEVNSAP